MAQSELLYELDDRPGVIQSLTAAFQHVLASFVLVTILRKTFAEGKE